MVDASDAQQICAAALLEEDSSTSDSQLFTSGSAYITSRATRAQLSALSPRSKILTHIPFSIPFDVRVQVFRQYVQNDWRNIGQRVRNGEMEMDGFRRRRAHAVVRRGSVAEDGFKALGGMRQDLKLPVAITFVDQWGHEECVFLLYHFWKNGIDIWSAQGGY
jgi:ubiquitin-protein ligase E3 C